MSHVLHSVAASLPPTNFSSLSCCLSFNVMSTHVFLLSPASLDDAQSRKPKILFGSRRSELSDDEQLQTFSDLILSLNKGEFASPTNIQKLQPF